jgi:hypothetical protein
MIDRPDCSFPRLTLPVFIGFAPAIDPGCRATFAGRQFQTSILVPWSAQETPLEQGHSRWVEFTSVCIQDSSSERRNFHILRCPEPTGCPGSFPLRARSRSVLRGIARNDAARCASTYGSNAGDETTRLCMVYPSSEDFRRNFSFSPRVEPN